MTLTLAHIALGFALGLAVGVFHFASLKQVTALYLGGSPVRAIALQLLRLAVLAGLMVALVLLDIPAFAAGALGVIVGREIVLRRVRKEA